jgi:hypothetical protein
MMQYWCLNFDGPQLDMLNYGLEKSLWMMQYQYSQGGQINQGHKPSAIANNWKAAQKIAVDDLCVAYLRPNTFYAIGRVIPPRKGKTDDDTVERTIQQRSHLYTQGVVYYADARALYEDFDDPWSIMSPHQETGQMERYPYAQRVDVDGWQYARKSPKGGAYIGKIVRDLPQAVTSFIQHAAFSIEPAFFYRLERLLSS